MGQKEIVGLLQENLKQEQAMAKTVEKLETQLGKTLLTPLIEEMAAQEAAADD
jgi:uncharacterized protein Yka (UPF0111/DUF47 family)